MSWRDLYLGRSAGETDDERRKREQRERFLELLSSREAEDQAAAALTAHDTEREYDGLVDLEALGGDLRANLIGSGASTMRGVEGGMRMVNAMWGDPERDETTDWLADRAGLFQEAAEIEREGRSGSITERALSGDLMGALGLGVTSAVTAVPQMAQAAVPGWGIASLAAQMSGERFAQNEGTNDQGTRAASAILGGTGQAALETLGGKFAAGLLPTKVGTGLLARNLPWSATAAAAAQRAAAAKGIAGYGYAALGEAGTEMGEEAVGIASDLLFDTMQDAEREVLFSSSGWHRFADAGAVGGIMGAGANGARRVAEMAGSRRAVAQFNENNADGVATILEGIAERSQEKGSALLPGFLPRGDAYTLAEQMPETAWATFNVDGLRAMNAREGGIEEGNALLGELRDSLAGAAPGRPLFTWGSGSTTVAVAAAGPVEAEAIRNAVANAWNGRAAGQGDALRLRSGVGTLGGALGDMEAEKAEDGGGALVAALDDAAALADLLESEPARRRDNAERAFDPDIAAERIASDPWQSAEIPRRAAALRKAKTLAEVQAAVAYLPKLVRGRLASEVQAQAEQRAKLAVGAELQADAIATAAKLKESREGAAQQAAGSVPVQASANSVTSSPNIASSPNMPVQLPVEIEPMQAAAAVVAVTEAAAEQLANPMVADAIGVEPELLEAVVSGLRAVEQESPESVALAADPEPEVEIEPGPGKLIPFARTQSLIRPFSYQSAEQVGESMVAASVAEHVDAANAAAFLAAEDRVMAALGESPVELGGATVDAVVDAAAIAHGRPVGSAATPLTGSLYGDEPIVIAEDRAGARTVVDGGKRMVAAEGAPAEVLLAAIEQQFGAESVEAQQAREVVRKGGRPVVAKLRKIEGKAAQRFARGVRSQTTSWMRRVRAAGRALLKRASAPEMLRAMADLARNWDSQMWNFRRMGESLDEIAFGAKDTWSGRRGLAGMTKAEAAEAHRLSIALREGAEALPGQAEKKAFGPSKTLAKKMKLTAKDPAAQAAELEAMRVPVGSAVRAFAAQAPADAVGRLREVATRLRQHSRSWKDGAPSPPANPAEAFADKLAGILRGRSLNGREASLRLMEMAVVVGEYRQRYRRLWNSGDEGLRSRAAALAEEAHVGRMVADARKLGNKRPTLTEGDSIDLEALEFEQDRQGFQPAGIDGQFEQGRQRVSWEAPDPGDRMPPERKAFSPGLPKTGMSPADVRDLVGEQAGQEQEARAKTRWRNNPNTGERSLVPSTAERAPSLDLDTEGAQNWKPFTGRPRGPGMPAGVSREVDLEARSPTFAGNYPYQAPGAKPPAAAEPAPVAPQGPEFRFEERGKPRMGRSLPGWPAEAASRSVQGPAQLPTKPEDDGTEGHRWDPMPAKGTGWTPGVPLPPDKPRLGTTRELMVEGHDEPVAVMDANGTIYLNEALLEALGPEEYAQALDLIEEGELGFSTFEVNIDEEMAALDREQAKEKLFGKGKPLTVAVVLGRADRIAPTPEELATESRVQSDIMRRFGPQVVARIATQARAGKLGQAVHSYDVFPEGGAPELLAAVSAWLEGASKAIDAEGKDAATWFAVQKRRAMDREEALARAGKPLAVGKIVEAVAGSWPVGTGVASWRVEEHDLDAGTLAEALRAKGIGDLDPQEQLSDSVDDDPDQGWEFVDNWDVAEKRKKPRGFVPGTEVHRIASRARSGAQSKRGVAKGADVVVVVAEYDGEGVLDPTQTSAIAEAEEDGRAVLVVSRSGEVLPQSTLVSRATIAQLEAQLEGLEGTAREDLLAKLAVTHSDLGLVEDRKADKEERSTANLASQLGEAAVVYAMTSRLSGVDTAEQLASASVFETLYAKTQRRIIAAAGKIAEGLGSRMIDPTHAEAVFNVLGSTLKGLARAKALATGVDGSIGLSLQTARIIAGETPTGNEGPAVMATLAWYEGATLAEQSGFASWMELLLSVTDDLGAADLSAVRHEHLDQYVRRALDGNLAAELESRILEDGSAGNLANLIALFATGAGAAVVGQADPNAGMAAMVPGVMGSGLLTRLVAKAMAKWRARKLTGVMLGAATPAPVSKDARQRRLGLAALLGIGKSVHALGYGGEKNALSWVQRLVTGASAKSQLGYRAAEAAASRSNFVKARLLEMGKLVEAYEPARVKALAAAEKKFGRPMSPEAIDSLFRAGLKNGFKGDFWGTVAVDLAEVGRGMRAEIDTASKSILSFFDVLPKALAAQIAKQVGTYVRESYDKIGDRKWLAAHAPRAGGELGSPMWEAAREAIQRDVLLDKTLSDPRARAEAERIISSALGGAPSATLGLEIEDWRQRMGGKRLGFNASIFSRLDLLPAEFRDLLVPTADPRVRAMRSAEEIYRSIASAIVTKELLETGVLRPTNKVPGGPTIDYALVPVTAEDLSLPAETALAMAGKLHPGSTIVREGDRVMLIGTAAGAVEVEEFLRVQGAQPQGQVWALDLVVDHVKPSGWVTIRAERTGARIDVSPSQLVTATGERALSASTPIGWMMQQEKDALADALRAKPEVGPVLGLLQWGASRASSAVTRHSVMGTTRNFLSETIDNRYLGYGTAPDAGLGLSGLMSTRMATFPPAEIELLRTLMERGVLEGPRGSAAHQDAPTLSAVIESLAAADAARTDPSIAQSQRFFRAALKAWQSAPVRGVRAAETAMEQAWDVGDISARFGVARAEYKRATQEYGMPHEQAVEHAAAVVSTVKPQYGNPWRWFEATRDATRNIAGPFMTFHVETLRTTLASTALAMWELTGNEQWKPHPALQYSPQMRKHGARRAAGLVASALHPTIGKAFLGSVGAVAMAMAFGWEDDEEVVDSEAVASALPRWAKAESGLKVFQLAEGRLKYMAAGFLDYRVAAWRLPRAILGGWREAINGDERGTFERWSAAVRRAAEQQALDSAGLFEPDMLLGKVLEAVEGWTQGADSGALRAAGDGSSVLGGLATIGGALVPLTYRGAYQAVEGEVETLTIKAADKERAGVNLNSVDQAAQWLYVHGVRPRANATSKRNLEDWALTQLTGMRVVEIDLARDFAVQGKQFGKPLTAARKAYDARVDAGVMGRTVEAAEFSKVQAEAERHWDWSRHYVVRMRAAGLDEDSINDALKAAGWGLAEQREALRYGLGFSPIEP